MEDTILETPNWLVRARTVAFSMYDPDDPAVKEHFSLREVLPPQPLEEFIIEMLAAYLEELREDIGPKFDYHYRDVVRYLRLRQWLKGQHDQRATASQPPFYVPHQEYWREVLSTITGREHELGPRSQPLTVHEAEILSSHLGDDTDQEERLRLARWGIRWPPSLSKEEQRRLHRELRHFWETFDEIIQAYRATKVDMQSAEKEVQELWRSTRKIVVTDQQTGRDIPITKFILDSINDEFLEFVDFAFDRLFQMIKSELSLQESNWLRFLYSCQRQFGGLMPGVSPAVDNFFAWNQDSRYLAILVYAFGMKTWRGQDLEETFAERFNTYLILYALQRGESGQFLTRDEWKRKKESKPGLVEEQDELDRLMYSRSAPETEEIVLRNIDEERLDNFIATKFTSREAQVIRLLLQGYNRTDAARVMGISPQRVSQLIRQIRKKLLQMLAGRDDFPSFADLLDRD